jgi:RNA polymerase sigma factor (sigma-70 family)
MALLASGHDPALNELVRRWRERLAGFLYQMTRDQGTALDLTQETFVRIYRHRKRYQPSASFPAWVFRIAGNLARDHARWRLRRPTVPFDEVDATLLFDTAPSPDQAASGREEIGLIHAAVTALPTALREALVLFVYEDLSYTEIAEITGGSPKSAEMKIYRARQLLRDTLDR